MNEIMQELRETMMTDPRLHLISRSVYFAIFDTYEFFHKNYGRASCALVADRLNMEGFRSPRGLEISRMMVWRSLDKAPAGRKLLDKTKKRTGHTDV